MDTSSDPHPVSTLSQIWSVHVPEYVGHQERLGHYVKADMNFCSLGGIDPQNRTAWRSGISSASRLLPTPATGTPTADEKLNQDQVNDEPICDDLKAEHGKQVYLGCSEAKGYHISMDEVAEQQEQISMECVEVVENLSQREKNKILSVLKRDERLQQSQDRKIRDLKHDIQTIRMKSVLRAGDDSNKMCMRCRELFGFLFNRGTICPVCHVKVCKDCQEYLFNGSWLCVMCFKQRQLKWLTGEWALSQDENPLRKWASGSDLIRASMKLKPMSTTSIDIDDPPQHRGATSSSGKPSQNGVHGSEQGAKSRVGYPKEGDQHRLSQLFDVLRTRKPAEESPHPGSKTEIKRVTSRRYSESDSDSSTSSYGDENSVRSTALSMTESELDARRLDSPPSGDASPRQIGSPSSSDSPKRLKDLIPDRSDEGPDRDGRGQKPKATSRSPKPSPRQKKRQKEAPDPQKSPVQIKNEPVDPDRVVRPKVRPRSGEKSHAQGRRSPRNIADISEETAGRDAGGKDLLQVDTDLQMHVSRTRESLDKKQEVQLSKSRTSLDSPVKSSAGSPSESMRSLGEPGPRQSSDNLSVRSGGSDGRAKHRKSEEKLNSDKTSRSSRQDLTTADVDNRTSSSRERVDQANDHDIQIDVSDVQESYPSQSDITVTPSDGLSDKTESKQDMQAMDDDQHVFIVPPPRTGSPYSFSMDSLPSSHASPTTRRSIGESSIIESSDTDSLSRYSHSEVHENSGTESAAKEGSEEDFVVEEISKIRFKTVSKKLAQVSMLTKISKSPNRNDLPGEMGQRAGASSQEGREEGGDPWGALEEGGISEQPCVKINISKESRSRRIIFPDRSTIDSAEVTETSAGATDEVFEKSKLGKDLSWFNEFEKGDFKGSRQAALKTTLPRHLTSSVASDNDRIPSEADSIEGMIDDMAKPVIYMDNKKYIRPSVPSISDSLTPVSPIDFPSEMFEQKVGNYKLAFDMSDDNLDSADDLLEEDDLDDSNVSPQDEKLDEEKHRKKMMTFKTQSSLDSLLDDISGDTDIENEFEDALRIAELKSREVSDDEGKVSESQRIRPAVQSEVSKKAETSAVALQGHTHLSKDSAEGYRQDSPVRQKPPLAPMSSLDLLLENQGDNVDRNLINVQLDEELLAAENLSPSSCPDNSPLEPEIHTVTYLGVQVASPSGTKEKSDNFTSDYLSTFKPRTDQSDSSGQSQTRKPRLVPVGYVAMKDSSDSSDSDMLSAIEEEDEEDNEAGDLDTEQYNKQIKPQSNVSVTPSANVEEEECDLESDHNVSTQHISDKIYRKVQYMEQKVKAQTQTSGLKKAIEKKKDNKSQDKYKKLKERWMAIEKHEADMLDFDDENEETERETTGQEQESLYNKEDVSKCEEIPEETSRRDSDVYETYQVNVERDVKGDLIEVNKEVEVELEINTEKEEIKVQIHNQVQTLPDMESETKADCRTSFDVEQQTIGVGSPHKTELVVHVSDNKSQVLQSGKADVDTIPNTEAELDIDNAKENNVTIVESFEKEEKLKNVPDTDAWLSRLPNAKTDQTETLFQKQDTSTEEAFQLGQEVEIDIDEMVRQSAAKFNLNVEDILSNVETNADGEMNQGPGELPLEANIEEPGSALPLKSELMVTLSSEQTPKDTCTEIQGEEVSFLVVKRNTDLESDKSPLLVYQTTPGKEDADTAPLNYNTTASAQLLQRQGKFSASSRLNIDEKNSLCCSIAEMVPEYSPQDSTKVIVEGSAVELRRKPGTYTKGITYVSPGNSIHSRLHECKSIEPGEPDDIFYHVPSDEESCQSIDEDKEVTEVIIKSVKDKKVTKLFPGSILVDSEGDKDRENDKEKRNSDHMPLTRVTNLKGAAPKPSVLPESSPLFEPDPMYDPGPCASPPHLSPQEAEMFRAPVAPPRRKRTSSSVSSSSDQSCSFTSENLEWYKTERMTPSRESPQTISECSGSQDDSGHVSGGSCGNTPEHVRQVPEIRYTPEHKRTESNYSQSSLPSTLSTVTDRSEEEEDIDKVVALHTQYGSRGNLLSVTADSRESIASYYSDAGDFSHSNVPVTGDILFGLNYNYKTSMLEVAVRQCREIAIVDARRNRTDPYVKCYLLPDKTRGGKRKTKVKKHTTNPWFDETLRYSISKSELENRTLWVTVWHNDRFGRNTFLGEVTINFDYYKFTDPTPVWYRLQERTDTQSSSMMVYKGDLSIRIRYVPADKTANSSPTKGKQKPVKGRLEVFVKEARNLTAVRSNGFSDPFCKGYLLPERHKSSKQKTSVIKKNCNPAWKHTFVFEDVSPIELRERCLELTIWDYEKLSSNDFLGGVRLNLGAGVSAGKPVDWMDARGEEMSMWQAMLDRPNLWIDGALILRPNMEKRKF